MAKKPVDTAIVMVVGPCIDDTDFKSLEESIAYDAAGMDISLIVEKADNTSAVTAITLTSGGANDWTHKDGGYYEVEITSAQNTEEGIAFVRGVCTGVLPFESFRYEITPANIYDAFVKGTDYLKVDALQISGEVLQVGGTSGYPVVDAQAISDSTDAANNVEANIGDLDASIAGLNNISAGDVSGEVGKALVSYDPPTNSEMEARTIPSADYFDPAVDTVADVTAVTNEVTADMVKISGDSTAADNMEATYDGTGYSDDAAPATQEQIGRLTSGTAAINTVAESFTKKGAEPETNTYTATLALDGSYHIVGDDATSTDCYYQFDVGGNGIPVSITWQGYAQGQGDSYSIYAYNYGTTLYEQIGTISATNITTLREEAFSLTTAHVGTGANKGKVRFRFESSDGTAFATDRILCSYSVVVKTTGYSDGAIWINTLNSNTNTEDYVDGTADNPVSTWTAAKTLSASLGIKKFHVVNGSTITMDANCDDFTFVGYEWVAELGGQSFENAHIEEATVSGTGTAGSGEIHFRRCLIGGVSLGKSKFNSCGFNGTNYATAAATYVFDNCYNASDGSVPPVFDYGGAVGDTHGAFRNWQGGIEIANLGASGTDVFSVTGRGQVVIASDCVGGTIKIVGAFTVTDNVVGEFSGTLNEDARYDVAQIRSECDDALDTYDPPTNAEMEARTLVSDGYFDPSSDTVVDVTTVGSVSGNVDGSVGSLAAQAKSDVSGEVDSAIIRYDPPTKTEMDAGFAGLNDLSASDVSGELSSALSNVNTAVGDLTEDDSGVLRFTENALEEAPTGGTAPTVAEVRIEMDDNSTKLTSIDDKTTNLPSDPADQSQVESAISTSESNIRGADSDTLETLSDQIDIVQTDLDNPDQYKADISGVATSAALTTHDTDIKAYVDKIDDGTDGLTAIKAEVEGLGGAAMRGTDSAALASVCTETRLAELDAANLPTDIDTMKAKTDNLPSGIAKNTALSNFNIYMVLTSDHVTAATGKTIAGTISKDGGAFVALANAVSEIGTGIYKVDLTQAEMNADAVTLKFSGTDCDQRIVVIYPT